jgi:pimeloyl-ACP methyl ester carboxylesterase
VVIAAALGAVLLAACGSLNGSAGTVTASAPTEVWPGPLGDDFYQPPSPMPLPRHGSLIWERAYDDGGAIPGAVNTLLLYTQQGISGQTVATSGILAVPNGNPPPGGWPVITWGHATTGIADSCAPSRTPGHGAADVSAPLLSQWVRDGYAVVETDYEGLGTPGTHPFMIGSSEGRSMLDIVRAARAADPRLSSRVVIAGYSQGGHAALWAASLAPSYAPELTVEATVAFAPASHLASSVAASVGSTQTGPATLLLLLLRGADTGDAALNVGGLISQQAQPYWAATLTTCLVDLNAGAIPLGALYRPGANLSGVIAEITRNDPGQLRIAGPVLLLQGLSDATVNPLDTMDLDNTLNRVGDQAILHVYPGATHATVLMAAADDATAFVRQHLVAS